LYFLAPDSDPDRDKNAATATESQFATAHRYDAIGDSITFGIRFNFVVDGFGNPKKTSTTFQGWPDLLGHMLTERTGANIEVSNRGHSGDRVATVQEKRFRDYLKNNTATDRALLLLGTINSSAFNTTPSGEGCTGTACNQTFKGDLLAVIALLRENGRDLIHVARIPPVWGPNDESLYEDPLEESAKRNRSILEYNRVITHEIANHPNVRLGPDFFSCFLTPTVNRFSLFDTHIHPNALGYVLMAALWRDAITTEQVVPPVDACVAPIFILESLDSYVHGHKQNLLDVGDKYYTDEPFTLTSIPSELANGIWVSQANADNSNTDASYLNFDAGASPVFIYIAYDSAGSPPTSKTHQFRPTTLSSKLIVSDPLVDTFSIVMATGVTGMVVIGGNRSNPAAAPQQGYVVIVVP